MKVIRTLLFRRFNKILNWNLITNEYDIVNVYKSEREELIHHTSLFDNKDYFGETCGYYFKGLEDDILLLYVINGEIRLRFKHSDFKLLDNSITFKCTELNDNNWVFECYSENDCFHFTYKPYAYAEWDDEDITDVNYGLFILLLLKDTNRRDHFINHNNIKTQ